MSQPQLNDQTKLITTQLLPNQWTLWFSYSCDSQNGINYSSNLMQIQKVRAWNDFMLLWKWTSKTENFFINPDDGSYQKYKFGIEERKVDSINFFRDSIEPQWEFGDNSKYGYFNFGVQRNSQRTNQIFEATVFLAVGQAQDWTNDIFGVRIVDVSSKPTHPCRARVQIWVRFRHDNSKESFDRLLVFQDNLKKYYKDSIEQDVNQLKFFNIGGNDEQIKSPRKDYQKKDQAQYKGNKKYDNKGRN